MEENKDTYKITEKWGFRQNPYDKNELREEVIEKLFVGRREEISEFFRTLNSGNNAFCIEGGFGVGKSSFFNICIHKIKKEYRGDIIDTTQIDMATQETTHDFLRVISNYVGNAIYKESKSHEGWKDYQDIIDDLIGNQKTNITSTGLNGGLSAGLAIKATRSKATSTTKGGSNIPSLMIENLSAIGKICQQKSKKILVPFENMEKAKLEGHSEKCVEFVKPLRKLIFDNNFIFIFIGDVGLREFFDRSGMLRSVIGNSIVLEKLSIDEYDSAITRRLDYFKTDKLQYTVPFANDIIKYVYEKSEGDIRWGFNFLNRLFEKIMTKDVKKYSLNDKIIRENIYYFTKARYNALSESEKKVLDKLMEIEEPLSPSDEKLQKACNLTQSTLQKMLSELAKNPEIIKKNERGRKHLYELGYEAKIYKEFEK